MPQIGILYMNHWSIIFLFTSTINNMKVIKCVNIIRYVLMQSKLMHYPIRAMHLNYNKQCIWTTNHKSLPFMHNEDAFTIKSSTYDVFITYETIKHIYYEWQQSFLAPEESNMELHCLLNWWGLAPNICIIYALA